MNRVATELLKLAKDILVEVTIRFDKNPDIQDSIYTAVHSEMQRMADRIRRNEGIEIILNRKDTADAMEIGVGFSKHEAKKAILEEFGNLASKLAKRNGLEPVDVSYL